MATISSKLSGHRDRKSFGPRTNKPLLSMGSPVGSDDERFDAETVLFTKLQGRSQQASESQVKSHLKQEADTVATKPEHSFVYANVRGFSFLDNLDQLMRTVETQTRELKEQRLQLEKLTKESQREIKELKGETQVSKNRIEMLEDEARESKSETEAQKVHVLALQGRVADLGSISQGYFDIRNRFLDNYNKKVKRDPEYQQSPAIEIGNQRAHGGDARVDALLYREGARRRRDPETFKELYGIDHSKVFEIAKSNTDGEIVESIIGVLNARATKVAQKKPFSHDLEDAFKLYVARFDQAGVRSAYLRFWKIHKKEFQDSK